MEPPPRRPRRARLNQFLRRRRRLVRHLCRRLQGNRRVHGPRGPRLRPRRRDRHRARVYSRKTRDLLFEVFCEERGKVATAAAVAVVVTIVLLGVFFVSFVFYRCRSRSRGIFELVDVSPVSTLAAPGIAAPSVVGKRPTPSPLRGSPPPRALRPTGALLAPPREGGGGEFPSYYCVHLDPGLAVVQGRPCSSSTCDFLILLTH